jgi:uncharacterized protein (DUF736 family)
MADVGTLTMEKGALFGRLRTLSFKLFLEFEPIEDADRRGTESPNFTVYARQDGDLIPVGAAWWKVTQRPRQPELRWLSITLDDPSFPTTLNVAAFPDEAEKDLYRIVWTRPRQAGREAA